MSIETKYKMDQEIFSLNGSMKKIQSGKVNGIYLEVKKGPDGIVSQNAKYTIHTGVGPLPEADWFESKKDLLNSL